MFGLIQKQLSDGRMEEETRILFHLGFIPPRGLLNLSLTQLSGFTSPTEIPESPKTVKCFLLLAPQNGLILVCFNINIITSGTANILFPAEQ